MTREPDSATAIAALRGRGAEPFDPVRLHFLESLARRAQEHQGAVKRLLEDRLSHSLAQYQQRLVLHEEAAGDLQRQERGHKPDTLAGLTRTLAQHLSADAQASADAGDVSVGFRPELKSIRNFRQTWSRLSVDRQLAQAIEQGPDNAGPFNSHQLVLRALSMMRDIAPHYLNRFMSHADALLWLDQAAGKAVAKSTADGESGKKRKTSRAR